MIRDGALTLDDEVCSANNFWFYLHEHEEVTRQLGIQLPKSMYDGSTEEPTESLTVEISEESTDPDVDQRASEGAELDASSTTVLSAEALRKKFQRKPITQVVRRTMDQGQFHNPVVVSQVEKTPLWAWITWLLLGVAGFLVFYVLRLLSVRQGGI